MVSQDGGVPFVSKSWDGNASDTKIFQERAEALIATFKNSQMPRYVVADAKLYNEDNATHRFTPHFGDSLKRKRYLAHARHTGEDKCCPHMKASHA